MIKTILSLGVATLLFAIIVVGAAACGDDDDDYAIVGVGSVRITIIQIDNTQHQTCDIAIIKRDVGSSTLAAVNLGCYDAR